MRRLLLIFVATFALTFPAVAQTTEDDRDAIRDVLKKQCREWNGAIEIRGGDGTTQRLDAHYRLTESGNGFEGAIAINGQDLAIAIQPQQGDTFSGRFGSHGPFRAILPRDLRGKPKARTILWVGSDGAFQMLLDHEAFVLTISGDVPLPDNREAGAVWTTAEFGRAGFRIVLGPFAITLMECLGIFSTLFFASRFLIQWIASERAKKSVMPEIFWWVSLIGAGLMIIYAIYFGRFAVLLGQLTGWIVYIRNIWLIELHKRQNRAGEGEITLSPPEER